ncbi:MAG: toprim domain-containing protein [Candidatus Paceibacterota bacterium]
MLPEPIKNFIAIFSKLPSIGLRQATRLAFYLISKGKNQIEETAKVISDLKYLKLCSQCFFVHSNKDNLCDICRDKNREKNIFMILEKETDLISIERTKKFKGRYLLLGELTKSGNLESVQKLRLNHLKNIIKKELNGLSDEIIIATNPTTYGDLNAMIITKELKDSAKKITRLGRGIPTGGEIEFADEETLGQALERRI